MQAIQAVIIEPVGCLAEFRAEEFNEATLKLSKRAAAGPKSGSQAYWRFVGLLARRRRSLTPPIRRALKKLELQAIENSQLYDDVTLALRQLMQMDIKVLMASSLSRGAVGRFLEKFSLRGLFTGTLTRDEASGVMARPLLKAIKEASLDPSRTIYLADTEEGLEIAKEVGVNSILMINDHDEGHRLAGYNPAGGIVSLSELPDGLRLIAQQPGI
jgi:beta-phosphoglucomutase-like phosphatase (HAD superfamily)